eukprot:3719793-Rhodomonas_salina.4
MSGTDTAHGVIPGWISISRPALNTECVPCAAGTAHRSPMCYALAVRCAVLQDAMLLQTRCTVSTSNLGSYDPIRNVRY